MLSFYLSLLTSEKDKEIIRYIYVNYYKHMTHIAVSYVHNINESEDVVHNVMLVLIEKIEILDTSDTEKLKHLCSMITKRKAIDYMRKKSRSELPVEEIYDTHNIDYNYPEVMAIDKLSVNLILKAITRLNDTYKEVLELKLIHKLKDKDIAFILGISVSAACMRIHRAREMLANELRKESFDV